jgi:hypothetical protein
LKFCRDETYDNFYIRNQQYLSGYAGDKSSMTDQMSSIRISKIKNPKSCSAKCRLEQRFSLAQTIRNQLAGMVVEGAIN